MSCYLACLLSPVANIHSHQFPVHDGVSNNNKWSREAKLLPYEPRVLKSSLVKLVLTSVIQPIPGSVTESKQHDIRRKGLNLNPQKFQNERKLHVTISKLTGCNTGWKYLKTTKGPNHRSLFEF